ncbi:right-handed parallel beta-helix repeat-containing protein [Candidatus Woesearchaeota archaeon]|nr:right-handed parallel beta-helix repeat-containing protein [Candidatus Woesearchaeota archaeon]
MEKEGNYKPVLLLLTLVVFTYFLFSWTPHQLQSPTGLQSAETISHATFLAHGGELFQTTLDLPFENSTLNDTQYAQLNGTTLLFNPPENSTEYHLLATTPEQILSITFIISSLEQQSPVPLENTEYANETNYTMSNETTQLITPQTEQNATNPAEPEQTLSIEPPERELALETTADRGLAVDFDYCPITINDSSSLTESVATTASCVLFGADNITLDCNGYVITWNTAGANSNYAVFAENKTNITVKNCILIDRNSSGTFGVGINMTKSSNVTLMNNTIQTNGSSSNIGIYLQHSNVSNITQNTIQTNGTTSTNYGIQLLNSSTSTVLDNTVRTGGTSDNYGVYLTLSASNNTITNNTITTNGTDFLNYGIYLSSSSSNNVTSNTVNTNGTDDNYGIYLESSSSNNVNNNIVNTNGTSSVNIGIILATSSSNNVVNNNTISTNGTNTNYGIYLFISSSNNVVSNNVVNTNGTSSANSGIVLNAVSSNNVTSNTIQTSGTILNHGVSIQSTSYNNTITNLTITTSGSANNTGIRFQMTGTNQNGNLVANSTIRTLGINSSGIGFITSHNNTLQNITLNNTVVWITSQKSLNNSLSNITFLNANGSIRIIPAFMSNGTEEVNQTRLNITNNSAFLNSSNLTWLNTTAQITLNGITFTTSHVQADFIDTGTFPACSSPTCVNQSYTGGVFIFNVTRFTTYRAAETVTFPAAIIQDTTLDQNLGATASAINFSANAISTDCQGNVITWNTAGGVQNFAISAIGRNNITLANCVFINGSSNSPGFNFTNTTNITVTNVTLRASADSFALVVQNASVNMTNTTFNNSANWMTISSNGSVNLTNVTFRTENGTINFPGTIALNGNFTITQAQVNITNHTVFINSTNLSAFNTTAQITLFNLTEANPRLFITEDGTTFTNCSSPTCTRVSYTNGTAIFNVTHFSTYVVSESGINISFTKTDSQDPVFIGTTFTYVINITLNESNATNVTVIETYPAQITYLSSQPSPVSGSSNRNFSLGNLTNTTFEVNITVNASSAGTSTNIANVTFLNASNQSLNYTVNETTTIQEIPSSGGSGGVSGSTGSVGPGEQHAAQTATMTTQTATFALQKADTVVFNVHNEQHTLSVISITPRTVTIRVESTPQEFTLHQGESINVDVNDDHTNDLHIKLHAIDTTGAHITMTKLVPPIKITLQPQTERAITLPNTKNNPILESPQLIQTIHESINNQKSQAPQYSRTTKIAVSVLFITLITVFAILILRKPPLAPPKHHNFTSAPSPKLPIFKNRKSSF